MPFASVLIILKWIYCLGINNNFIIVIFRSLNSCKSCHNRFSWVMVHFRHVDMKWACITHKRRHSACLKTWRVVLNPKRHLRAKAMSRWPWWAQEFSTIRRLSFVGTSLTTSWRTITWIQINKFVLVRNTIWVSRVVRSEPQARRQMTHPHTWRLTIFLNLHCLPIQKILLSSINARTGQHYYCEIRFEYKNGKKEGIPTVETRQQ